LFDVTIWSKMAPEMCFTTDMPSLSSSMSRFWRASSSSFSRVLVYICRSEQVHVSSSPSSISCLSATLARRLNRRKATFECDSNGSFFVMVGQPTNMCRSRARLRRLRLLLLVRSVRFGNQEICFVSKDSSLNSLRPDFQAIV
jgi:hypothetical protein